VKSRANARLKRVRAVELLTAGYNYDQIAQEVGFTSRGSAHRAVTKALAEREIEAVGHLRALELERLDALHAAFWHQAINGDIPATQVILAISRQRLRLYGPDRTAPRKESLYGPNVLVQPWLEGNPREATRQPRAADENDSRRR